MVKMKSNKLRNLNLCNTHSCLDTMNTKSRTHTINTIWGIETPSSTKQLIARQLLQNANQTTTSKSNLTPNKIPKLAKILTQYGTFPRNNYDWRGFTVMDTILANTPLQHTSDHNKIGKLFREDSRI